MNNTPTAPRRMTRNQTRTRQIARIKGLVRKLNWTDRRYRAALQDVLLLDSIRRASRTEREVFTRFLEVELAPRSAPYTPAELDRIVNASSIDELLA